MNRREVIKRTALLMGGAVSAPAIMAILNGCKAQPGVEWTPEYFTQDQAFVVTELAEIIIPKTDTPGAKDAGVPAFIEKLVAQVYSQENRETFMAGLESFTRDSNFLNASPEARISYVNSAHETAAREMASPRPFIMTMKELTLLGFFTSKPGVTEVLQYEAVPGRYIGCQPLAEVGKAWAS